MNVQKRRKRLGNIINHFKKRWLQECVQTLCETHKKGHDSTDNYN